MSHWRGKVVCRSTKAAISLKRVKIEEKLLPIATHQRFFERLHPDPYELLFLKIVLCTPTQNSSQSLLGLSQERVKVQTSNFVRTVMQGLPKIFKAPI